MSQVGARGEGLNKSDAQISKDDELLVKTTSSLPRRPITQLLWGQVNLASVGERGSGSTILPIRTMSALCYLLDLTVF